MTRASIQDVEVKGGKASFTISGCSSSLPNALRRTILSDIPCIAIDTDADSASQVRYVANTTRQTNEMISQRLAAVPVHVTDVDFPFARYSFQIKAANDTDTPIMITTKNIEVFDKENDRPVTQSEIRKLFPPNPFTSDFIDLALLRPGAGPSLAGERLHLTGSFKVGVAAENGSYAVATEATCLNTQDTALVKSTLAAREKEWLGLGLTPGALQVRRNDFLRLDARRLNIPRSFRVSVATVGVFNPTQLIVKAFHIIVGRLNSLTEAITSDPTLVKPSTCTIPWAYNLTIGGDGHTIGRLVESTIFDDYYTAEDVIAYCGFVKPHPHINTSILKFSFTTDTDQAQAAAFVQTAIVRSREHIEALLPTFS